MGLVISVVALVVQFVLTVATLVATIVSLPFVALEAILALFASALATLIALLQNRYFAIGLIVFLLYIFVVGPFAQDNTSDVIEFFNFLYECFFRPFYEVIDKFILVNIQSAYITASNAINNAFIWIGYNAKILWADLRSILECYYLNGDWSAILEVPYSLWKFFIGPVLYLFETAPLLNKNEIFNDRNITRDWGYHYPLENPFDPPFPRFEYNPFYDAQGPAIQPITRPFFHYPARGQRIQFLRIVEDAGLFFWRIVSDVRYPSNRFFPNFILRTGAQPSYWREGGDLVCRVAEWSTITSIWPWNPFDGSQPLRTEFTRYLCTSIRIIGNILRFISLILTDLTTFQRQNTFNATCTNTTSNFIARIVGVPVVDLFVTPALPNSNVILNLNIFKSNYRFCKFTEDAINNSAIAPAALQFCDGLAAGSYLGNNLPGQRCIRWPGLIAPTSNDRIDYVAEFTLPLKQFVELLLRPAGAAADQFQATIDRAFLFLNQVLDFLTSQLIYFFNAIGRPLCDFGAVLAQFNRYFNDLFISLLELIYQPDTCADAVGFTNQDSNIFYCLIALGSRANQPFFQVLCRFFDGVATNFFQIQELNCDTTGPQNRKRETLASERFTESQEPLSFLTRMRMYSYAYAYYTREMLRDAHECLLNEQNGSLIACNSSCSLAPCLPKGLDCIYSRLPEQNPWSEWLRPANVTLGENDYTRSALITAAMTLDVSRGCNDNIVRSMHSSLSAVVNLLRDFVVRYILVTEKFAPTFDNCMRAAHEQLLNSTLTIEQIQRNYLTCIGMKPSESATEDVWSATLKENGIVPSDREVSRCANILHRMKLIIEDVESETTLSYDHSLYRSCGYMMAFGAQAVASRSTNLSVSDFVDHINLPFAVLSSTQNVDSTTYASSLSGLRHVPQLPAPLPYADQLQIRPAAYVQSIADTFVQTARVGSFHRSNNANNRTSYSQNDANTAPQTPLAAMLYSTHQIASFGYAYFNYLADVFEHVIRVKSTGEDKDELATKLYGRIVAVVGAADSIGRDAQQQFGRRVRSMEREAEADGNVYEKRAVVSPSSVFRVFGSSLFWVDRMSMFADDEVKTPKAASSALATRMRKAGGVDVEMYVNLGRRVAGRQAPLLLGMRTIDDLTASDTHRSFAPMTADAAMRYNQQERYSVSTLDDVRKALQTYLTTTSRASSSDADVARLRQQVVSALELSKRLDSMLTMRSYSDAVVERLGRSAYESVSMIMRVFWAVARSRIRPNSLPAVQMAHVTIDAMMNGESDDMSLLLEGKRGYIPGAGYVSREAYDEYMSQEKEKRDFFRKGYFYALDDNDAHHIYIYSARRNAKVRVEREVFLKFALAGGSAYSRLTAAKRAALKRMTFHHRALHLRKYGYDVSDDMMHHAAGPGWVHYERAKRSMAHGNNTIDRRILAQTVVDDASQDFINILDNLFVLLFGNSDGDFIAGLEDLFNQLIDVGESIFVDVIDNAGSIWDDIKASGSCQGPQNYRHNNSRNPDFFRINGTSSYRLGCLPLLDERLFNWIRVYPLSDPTPNFLNFFTGPGYIQWPDEMLLPGGDCPAPRVPEVQCPSNFSANLFSNPFDFVFNQVCITDFCKVAGFNDASIRPLCPFCDYCPRRWKNTAQFGLTNGYQVLAIYDQTLRFLFTNMYTHPEGFWFVIVLFLLLEFPSYFPSIPLLPISSAMLAAIVIGSILIGELFFQQRPERAVYTFGILVLVRLFADGAAWILFGVYVVVNFGPFFYGTAVFPAFQSFVDFVTQNLFLGSLLTYFLNALLFVDSILQAFGINAFTTDGLIAARDGFIATTAITTPPTLAQFLYSIFAGLRVFNLVWSALIVVITFGAVAFVAFIIAPSIFNIFGNLFAIFLLIYNFILGRRVSAVEHENDEQEDRIDQLEADRDELLDLQQQQQQTTTPPSPQQEPFQQIASPQQQQQQQIRHRVYRSPLIDRKDID